MFEMTRLVNKHLRIRKLLGNSVERGARSKGAPRFAALPRCDTLWENFKSIVGALAIFLVLRAFIVEAYRIPSGSMIPTLLVGDWLFVNKAIYGAHVPFSRREPARHTGSRSAATSSCSCRRTRRDEARRGAIRHPTLVKRLVGTPGDTLLHAERRVCT